MVGRDAGWEPAPGSGIADCEAFRLGTFLVEDCFVGTEQCRYVTGVVTGGRAYGIWDADARGRPIETFAATDEGWAFAWARTQDLNRAEASTAKLLAWIRHERPSRPW